MSLSTFGIVLRSLLAWYLCYSIMYPGGGLVDSKLNSKGDTTVMNYFEAISSCDNEKSCKDLSDLIDGDPLEKQ